jgi:hypothetical protein
VDRFSINRLILSDNALGSQAMISWPEAGAVINEAAALVRAYGYELGFWPVPLCVFRGDNAAFVEREVRRHARRHSVRSSLRYLDPVLASGTSIGRSSGRSSCAERAEPDVCDKCCYNTVCGGIEDWYYERFGTTGLGLDSRESA